MATSQDHHIMPMQTTGPNPVIHALGRLYGSFVGSFLIGAVAIAALLGLWQWLAVWFEVPTWLVPKPSDFLGRLVADWQTISYHAGATSLTILEGFALSVIVAVPLALAIVSIAALERGLYPVIVFLNIMPKTVIGPILIIWFGIGPVVAALIVFLMCFFPILVDSMSGFRAVDPRLFYISRSMGAKARKASVMAWICSSENSQFLSPRFLRSLRNSRLASISWTRPRRASGLALDRSQM